MKGKENYYFIIKMYESDKNNVLVWLILIHIIIFLILTHMRLLHSKIIQIFLTIHLLTPKMTQQNHYLLCLSR